MTKPVESMHNLSYLIHILYVTLLYAVYNYDVIVIQKKYVSD